LVVLIDKNAHVDISRRQARQRRDYLYRRALTLRDAEIAEKRKAQNLLATGKPLDPAIANDKELRKDYKYDESRPDRTIEEELDLDDEYAQLSGIVDPACSSQPRDPHPASPRSQRDPPSSTNIHTPKQRQSHPPNLVSSANASGLSDLILLHEHRGTPPL
jgi:U3 small nucleolar ribonucleoprotein protein IMP4